MYRVFIADDNELARQALKKTIAWETLNCELCGEAVNGNEALEMIPKQLPDIVLMDIKMPGISGIEVISELKQLSHSIVYIMVTAYDDFEYMRKGMQNGVFDYVLKPISDQELYEVLEKAVNYIEQQEQITREYQEKYDHYEITIRKTEEELEEKVFHDAINGIEGSGDRLANLLRRKARIHDYLIMLVIPERDVQAGEINTFRRKQNEIIKECSKNYSVYAKGIWRKEGYVILFNFKKSMFLKEYDILSLKIAEFIQKKNSMADYEVYITISRTATSFSEISELFGETIFCKNSRFFLENRNIIHYDSLRSSSVNGEYTKMKKLEDLYEACRGEHENITGFMEEFLEQFSLNEIGDINYVKGIMIQAVIMMVYIIRESYPNNGDVADVNDYVNELSKINSLQNTYKWMLEFARKIEEIKSADNVISIQTRKILDYLNLHYCEQITLQEVADYIGLTGTHVSRLLKKEIGETFITCLNKIRIKESVRLLKTGQYKVYEIAEMVGYNNYAYFYQIFKKSMSVSPKDYV